MYVADVKAGKPSPCPYWPHPRPEVANEAGLRRRSSSSRPITGHNGACTGRPVGQMKKKKKKKRENGIARKISKSDAACACTDLVMRLPQRACAMTF